MGFKNYYTEKRNSEQSRKDLMEAFCSMKSDLKFKGYDLDFVDLDLLTPDYLSTIGFVSLKVINLRTSETREISAGFLLVFRDVEEFLQEVAQSNVECNFQL